MPLWVIDLQIVTVIIIRSSLKAQYTNITQTRALVFMPDF